MPLLCISTEIKSQEDKSTADHDIILEESLEGSDLKWYTGGELWDFLTVWRHYQSMDKIILNFSTAERSQICQLLYLAPYRVAQKGKPGLLVCVADWFSVFDKTWGDMEERQPLPTLRTCLTSNFVVLDVKKKKQQKNHQTKKQPPTSKKRPQQGWNHSWWKRSLQFQVVAGSWWLQN